MSRSFARLDRRVTKNRLWLYRLSRLGIVVLIIVRIGLFEIFRMASAVKKELPVTVHVSFVENDN